MSIQASIEEIKGGAFFQDYSGTKFIKLQDILPSGIQQYYIRCDPKGKSYSNFSINAIYLDGGHGASCPYGTPIFIVESQDDLYDADMYDRAPKCNLDAHASQATEPDRQI